MLTYPIFLFDIDSVLVAPFGYRAAVRATLNYFYKQINFPESLLPDEDVLAGFEAIRITSEWDMMPICLAAALDSWMAANPGTRLIEGLPAAIRQINRAASTARPPQEIGYKSLQQRLIGRLKPGEYPADTVLKLAESDAPDLLFTHLTDRALLENLLAHTRDLDRSLTTSLFQHFTLGSSAYQTSYQRPALFQTESLLASLDQPLLPEELSLQIKIMQKSAKIYPVAFTMRPSLAPRGIKGSLPLRYVPEAEIALELVQLAEIPLIGYGRILYLADQLSLEPESLLKPSPVQAIAAILAAISGDEYPALVSAYNVYANSNPDLENILLPGAHLDVHVFEDSAGGIEAVHKAAALLTQSGFPTHVSGYGITTHPEKVSALRAVNATLYESTPRAVKDALAHYS